MNKKILYTLLVLALAVAVYLLFFKPSKVTKSAQALASKNCRQMGIYLPEIKKTFSDFELLHMSDNELTDYVYSVWSKMNSVCTGTNMGTCYVDLSGRMTRQEKIDALKKFINLMETSYNEVCKKS